MKIDFASLAFGYNIQDCGGNPNWSTALGQGTGHKINNNPEIDEILKGMLYSNVPISKVKTKIGKGGRLVSGSDTDSPITQAAVFKKVYVNDTLIENGVFVLLIVKDQNGSHAGRLKLKYGPSNTYLDGESTYTNETFFEQVRQRFNMADNACWFIFDISIDEQEKLILSTVIVNKNNDMSYSDSKSLHDEWESLIEKKCNTILSNKVDYDTITGSHINPIPKNKVAKNIILYGVPGCGKSHEIKTKYCDERDYMERVVFHPDYTYSDFVGQILPQSDDGHISYPFIPGPFTRILKKAVNDPSNNYYLVIEELNRGNAPAIFGEVFQLLDRKDGVSEYGINNADIAVEVYGNEEKQIKLPSNLFILATMNTADQNVFTLDTAFKRRWTMKRIPNDIEKCDFKDSTVCETEVTWCSFLTAINDLIIESSQENFGSEDKRLGAYFVSKEELNDIDMFSEKVLMYLWNDAFKNSHDKIFSTDYKTLDSLIDGFKEKLFEAFSNYFNIKLGCAMNEENSESNITTPEQYLEDKSEFSINLYNRIIEALNNDKLKYDIGAVKSYIAIRTPNNNNAANIILLKNQINIRVKEPQDENYKIGVLLKENSNYSNRYQIKVDEDTDVKLVVGAIIDSFNQINR